jgi:hypothetical protein
MKGFVFSFFQKYLLIVQSIFLLKLLLYSNPIYKKTLLILFWLEIITYKLNKILTFMIYKSLLKVIMLFGLDLRGLFVFKLLNKISNNLLNLLLNTLLENKESLLIKRRGFFCYKINYE